MTNRKDFYSSKTNTNNNSLFDTGKAITGEFFKGFKHIINGDDIDLDFIIGNKTVSFSVDTNQEEKETTYQDIVDLIEETEDCIDPDWDYVLSLVEIGREKLKSEDEQTQLYGGWYLNACESHAKLNKEFCSDFSEVSDSELEELFDQEQDKLDTPMTLLEDTDLDSVDKAGFVFLKDDISGDFVEIGEITDMDDLLFSFEDDDFIPWNTEGLKDTYSMSFTVDTDLDILKTFDYYLPVLIEVNGEVYEIYLDLDIDRWDSSALRHLLKGDPVKFVFSIVAEEDREILRNITVEDLGDFLLPAIRKSLEEIRRDLEEREQ